MYCAVWSMFYKKILFQSFYFKMSCLNSVLCVFFVIIGECSWFIILCFSETQLRMPNQHKYFYTINYRFTKYHSIKYNMINLWKKAWNIETILVTSSYWLQKQEERLLQQSWPSQTQSAYYCVTTICRFASLKNTKANNASSPLKQKSRSVTPPVSIVWSLHLQECDSFCYN